MSRDPHLEQSPDDDEGHRNREPGQPARGRRRSPQSEWTAWVAEVLGSLFRFAYEIQRASDHVLIATAETVHGWTDTEFETVTQLPTWLFAALDQLRP